MIYTLTPNPAIDMNVTANSVEKNVVSRTRDVVYTPNGKGLNVSFTLQHFGIRAPILGFFGGFSGRYIIDGARGRACEVHPVMVDGITRINTFVTCGPDEYKFPSAGCAVPRGRQLEMLELIDGLADLECLVVSGSLPPQIEPTFYDEVIHHVHARGAEVVLDTSHARLTELVEKRPLLIKPNDEEVAAIFGVDVKSEADIVSALRLIHEHGCKNILLTLGERGAYFYDGARVWRASAARVEVYSTACAGDATLASFLSLWFADRENVEGALRRAMATGGSVAMCAGLGDFARVAELEGQIRVEVVA